MYVMGKQNIDNASNSKKYTFRSLFIKIILISDERRLKNTTMIMTEKLNLTYRHVKHHWYPTTDHAQIFSTHNLWVKSICFKITHEIFTTTRISMSVKPTGDEWRFIGV